MWQYNFYWCYHHILLILLLPLPFPCTRSRFLPPPTLYLSRIPHIRPAPLHTSSNPLHSSGRKFWSEDGVADKIHVHIGPATDTLQRFIDEGQAGTFDFAFIDADKPNFDRYYEQCLVLLRHGGIIAFDNTVLNGRILDPDDQKPDALAVRKLNKKLLDDQRINLSFLKIGDGLSLCFIK